MEKCDVCKRVCVALDDGVGDHHHCQMYCMFHFKRTKNVMDEYCNDGVCASAQARALLQRELPALAGSPAGVASRHGRMWNDVQRIVGDSQKLMSSSGGSCHNEEYYCVKLCGSLSAHEHLFERCTRSCGRNFDKLEDVWKDYCRCGLCGCNK